MVELENDSQSLDDHHEDQVGKEIVDAAFYVHKCFGQGVLENVYEACLYEELKYRGLNVKKQLEIPVHFRETRLDTGFRIDLLVEDKVIVECKAIDKLLPIHEAHVLTYMRLTDKRLSYLINFNTTLIKNGIKRIVNRK